MALKINEQLQDTRIQYIALFPTICDMHVRKDVRLKLDFLYRPVVMRMCKLPIFIRYWLLQQMEGRHAEKLLARFTLAIFTLRREEFSYHQH